MSAVIDEEGRTMSSSDQDPRRSAIEVMDEALRASSDAITTYEATRIAVSLFHALRRAGWLRDTTTLNTEIEKARTDSVQSGAGFVMVTRDDYKHIPSKDVSVRLSALFQGAV